MCTSSNWLWVPWITTSKLFIFLTFNSRCINLHNQRDTIIMAGRSPLKALSTTSTSASAFNSNRRDFELKVTTYYNDKKVLLLLSMPISKTCRHEVKRLRVDVSRIQRDFNRVERVGGIHHITFSLAAKSILFPADHLLSAPPIPRILWSRPSIHCHPHLPSTNWDVSRSERFVHSYESMQRRRLRFTWGVRTRRIIKGDFHRVLPDGCI